MDVTKVHFIFKAQPFIVMKIFLFGIFTILASMCSIAQSDTTVQYFSKAGKETTKDSAFSYVKFYRQDNLWHGAVYYMKTGRIMSEGNYVEMNFEKPTGSFNNYKEDGKLDYTAEYVDGKPSEKIYYYKSGSKKSYISYAEKGNNLQKGWDETGKEIKNFVVEREAGFKGGPEGWRKYLEKHLNANIAADAGAPAGTYEVKVQFVINKEGLVSNVKAVSVPARCKPCGGEAVRAIMEAPQWISAVQNNEPVIYQAIQYVNFQVVDDSKKGKGKE